MILYYFVVISIFVNLTKLSSDLITDSKTFKDTSASALSSGYIDDKNLNKIKKFISKCCPMNKYVGRRKICTSYDEKLKLSSIDIYNGEFYKTNKSLVDIFNIEPGKFSDKRFRNVSKTTQFLRNCNIYLVESGDLYVEIPNAYNRWHTYNNDRFCVDYQLSKKTSPVLRLWIDLDDQESQVPSVYVTCAILVSCVFLLLVLIVYAVLPELRNLGGMILMAYVASLFMAFLLLAVIQSDDYDTEVCIDLTYSIYFSFLASFCWMSVMSYDIWWTFRGYAKARPIHRRGELFKFLMYCLYAWGLPLAMTITFAILNKANLKHMPWFITPNVPKMGCFLEGGQKLVYLYMPMLILIIFNWTFYLMTAFNVWRLNRGTSVLNSAAAGTPDAHRSQLHRFLVYLKLSVVMGLNWILEVASFVFPNFKVWYISDAYNLLIGFAIFLIFVCKLKIFRKLKKQYRAQKKLHWFLRTKSSLSSTSDSTSSQETQTLQVCSNPKGPGYQMKSF